jgi:tRNA (adenine9-N1/guanine9-N1)-methyltransferase
LPSLREVKRPSRALMEVLSEIGCSMVRPRVWVSPRKTRLLGFQYLAVEVLVNDYIIRRGSGLGSLVFVDEFQGKRMGIVMGKGGVEYHCEVAEEGEPIASWREVEARLPDPPFPVFVVDLTFWRLQTPEERARLRVQLAMALSIIRRYLWDRHLAITSVPEGAREELTSVMGRTKTFVTSSRPTELLWGLGAENVVILRPDAPEELTPEDLAEADAFLIGGIVDLVPRKGVSRLLDRMVPWGRPKRIALRGSVVGVPDRINRIVEIVLKAMLDYGGDVEKAIASSMTKRDVMRRLFIEVTRMAEKIGGRRVIRAEKYYEISKWLPARWEDFLEAARKAGVEVVGVEGGDTGS